MIREVFFFLLAGVIGFSIDAGGVFLISTFFSISAIPARIPGFALALMATFIINHNITFSGTLPAKQKPSIKTAFIKYLSANSVSQAVNFGLYTALVSMIPVFSNTPVFAVAASSLVAAVISFILFKYVVFKRHEKSL